MKPDSPSRTIWRGKCKRIKYLRKAPQEHWAAQNEGMSGWGFLNRGESLPCNRSFLEENQSLAQAPSSMGSAGSAIPFSLDAIPLCAQGLSPARAGAVPGCRCSPGGYLFPHHRSHTAAVHREAPDRHLSPTDYSKLYPPKISLRVHYWLPQFTSKSSFAPL